jgi:hypothetical protein
MLNRPVVFALAASILCGSEAGHASSAFTYFGELYRGGTPADGTYRFTITPYRTATGANALAPAMTTQSVRVVDGRFHVPVSFAFDGMADQHIWLDVKAWAADGTATDFSERQEVLVPIPGDAPAEGARAPEVGQLVHYPSRFSLMWLSAGVPHRAAIRGDGSIRDTDDNGLVVTIVGTGQYCVQATAPSEGAVGVAQWDGPYVPRTIDVSMGIGNPCANVPGAQIFVQTWEMQ